MAALSLLTPNLMSSNPKSLHLSCFFSKPINISNNLSFASSKSFSFANVSLRRGFGFARKVAVSSEYEEEVVSEEEVEQEELSPDLKLFVGNLPFSVDSAELAGLFGNAGNVEVVEVIYDKTTGRSRGFGFVTMSTAEEVEAAAQQFNGYEFKGRTLRVNSGPPPPSREERRQGGFRSSGGSSGGSYDSGNRLYVGNLSWGVDNSALEDLFSEQGKVMDAKVVYDRESGRSRGFGFVTYSTAEEANNAISSLDGSDLDGRTIRVTVAESRPPRRDF